jgi:hypothetical protein
MPRLQGTISSAVDPGAACTALGVALELGGSEFRLGQAAWQRCNWWAGRVARSSRSPPGDVRSARGRATCWLRVRQPLSGPSLLPPAICHTPAIRGARSCGRRRPEETLLCRTIQEHWSTFLADLEAGGGELPAFVLDEFEAYLRCGSPVHGLLRVRCKDCGHRDGASRQRPPIGRLFDSYVESFGNWMLEERP